MQENPYQAPETVDRATPTGAARLWGRFLARFLMSVVCALSAAISATTVGVILLDPRASNTVGLGCVSAISGGFAFCSFLVFRRLGR